MITNILSNNLNSLNYVPVPTVLCRIQIYKGKEKVKILFQNNSFLSLISPLLLRNNRQVFSFSLLCETLTDAFFVLHCKKSSEHMKPVTFEKQCKDLGTWYQFSMKSNNEKFFCLSVVEITVVKQSEIQLRNENIITRNYFNAIPCGIAVFDEKIKFLQANDFVCSVFGYSEKILQKMTLFELHPTKNISEIKNFFQLLKAHGSEDSIISVLTKSGKLLTLQQKGILQSDGTSLVVWTDITQLTKKKIKPNATLIYTQNLNLYSTIANLSELRDTDTGHHIKRIGIFAHIIAKKMGMNKKFCDDIEIFAQLHDIGKIGIQDAILLAPRKLSEKEYSIMKKHTILGHNIVKGNVELSMAAEITLNHHECYDGTGYPNGIYGYEIPLSAQITSIVDVYDALRSKRPYKNPWTHYECIEYISSRSGKNFNPEIIDTFLAVQKRIEYVYNSLSN